MIKLDEIYQNREFKTLDDIFSNDDTGLLDDVKPMAQPADNGSILQQQFVEINAFIDEHGYTPKEDGKTLQEKMLARRLAAIAKNTHHIQNLKALDKHGILNQVALAPDLHASQLMAAHKSSESTVTKEINSLEDIFAQDDLGLFDDIKSDILIDASEDTLTNRTGYDQYNDEEIAKRFECQDFTKFIPTFERIYHAIQSGKFSKASFSSVKNITKGSVFVLQGLLCYVADIYQAEARKNERNQQRLRLIFANGTESNMLIRSLATAQYKYDNSYQLIITDPDWVDDTLAQGFGDTRLMTGVIYVAKLKTVPDELRQYQNLHKIGYSTLTGEVRSKYSIKDTAFLQQPVNIIAEWQVYDANAQSVESVLHAFFSNQRVNMTVIDADFNTKQATEWFDVPLSEIEKAIELVIAGEINQYYLDQISLNIKKR